MGRNAVPRPEPTEVASGPNQGRADGRALGMSRRPGERWGDFAERVANAFGLVLILVIATYALGSLTAFSDWTGALTTLVACLAGVVGLAGAGARPTVVRCAAILGLVAVVLSVLSKLLDDLHLLGASSLVVVTLLLLAAGAILRTVLAETEVGFRTILGAISVYTILGLLFTFLYAALDKVESAPFFGSASVKGGDFLFFSYTTLTTTGYGNLVPAGQP